VSNTGGSALSAAGNITGGNIRTAGQVSATGNVTGGNVLGGANVNATTHTGTTVSVTANITGGNLLTGGLISATGNITGGNLLLTGSIIDTGDMIITSSAANANVILTPTGTGVVRIDKNLTNGQANGVGNIGSATGYFNTIFAKATSAQYADLAEMYAADRAYQPGQVLTFGGNQEVTLSQTLGDTRIAGVVSTMPSYLMNSALDAEHAVAVALTGRVPTSVTGSVRKGDMMVSAGDGTACASATPAMGSVLGKSLQDFSGKTGIIEIVVGRL
jgi:hypothetical protein